MSLRSAELYHVIEHDIFSQVHIIINIWIFIIVYEICYNMSPPHRRLQLPRLRLGHSRPAFIPSSIRLLNE